MNERMNAKILFFFKESFTLSEVKSKIENLHGEARLSSQQLGTEAERGRDSG